MLETVDLPVAMEPVRPMRSMVGEYAQVIREMCDAMGMLIRGRC